MDDMQKLQAVRAKLREAVVILATVKIPGAELMAEDVLDEIKFVDVMIDAEDDV